MNEEQELRRLIPINTLTESHFEQVRSLVQIQDATKGTTLFHQGDPANEFVYVLAGTVSLQAGGVEMDSVSGGSDVSRFALAHQNPRKVSAVARTAIRYVRIDPDWVKQRDASHPLPSFNTVPAPNISAHTTGAVSTGAVKGKPPKNSELVEDMLVEEEDDWMSSLLRSPIFMRLPPANLQAILRNLEEIPFKSGETVCRQGDEGDYFYIIKSGRCVLTRKPTPTAKDVRLAVLKACDTFGEDALISEKPRTVTATIETDSVLLRLEKAYFAKLIRDPILSYLPAKEAIELVKRGAGVWLDIRLPDHYQHSHPQEPCINAPFFSLRMVLSNLDREKTYITVCEDGKLSSAAAYLLMRFRFNAQVLKGGIATLAEEALVTGALSEQGYPTSSEGTESISSFKGEIPIQVDYAVETAYPSPIEEHVHTQTQKGASDAQHASSEHEKQRLDEERYELQQTILRLENALRQAQKLLEQQRGVTPDEEVRHEYEDLKTRYSTLLKEKNSIEQEMQQTKNQAKVEVLRLGNELTALRSQCEVLTEENEHLHRRSTSDRIVLLFRNTVMVLVDRILSARPTLAIYMGIGLLSGILLTGITLGGLFSLESGRELARSWLGTTISSSGKPPKTPTTQGSSVLLPEQKSSDNSVK